MPWTTLWVGTRGASLVGCSPVNVLIRTDSSQVLGTGRSAPWSWMRATVWLLDVSNLLVLCTLAQVPLGQARGPRATDWMLAGHTLMQLYFVEGR